MLRHGSRTFRPIDLQSLAASHHPRSQHYVRVPQRMVGMQVRQKKSRQVRRYQSSHAVPLGGLFGAADYSRARVKKVSLSAGHNRNGWAGTQRVRYRRAGTENDHSSRFGRKHEARHAGERQQDERSSAERRSAVDEPQGVEYHHCRPAAIPEGTS